MRDDTLDIQLYLKPYVIQVDGRILRDSCQIEYETHALMGTCDAFRIYIEDILYGGELPEELRLTFTFQHETRIYV